MSAVAAGPWESVIGLEVHVQLKTRTKLFCACPNSFGGRENSRICPVCAGFPGALPKVNAKAVELAVKAGLALGCRINLRSAFARKSYFYPDLPAGFQTSQLDPPVCGTGEMLLDSGNRVRITRIHLEDDAGKCLHEAAGKSLVDLNRAGTPLIEIVTEPDLRGPEEAVAFVRRLRRLLVYLDITDGNMEEGSLRCDVNLSLRPYGGTEYGIRAELKNLNSFHSIQDAIACEITRQSRILNSGGTVDQETRLYDPDSKTTRAMRSKEEAPDYRYFPNPDLPALELTGTFVDGLAAALPEFPEAREARFMQSFGLSAEEAGLLTAEKAVADYFESALAVRHNPKRLAGLMLGELLPECSRQNLALDSLPLTAAGLGRAAALIDKGTVSLRAVHELFSDLLKTGIDIEILAKDRGLLQVSDSSALERAVLDAISAHPEEAAAYKTGKTKLKAFFVGQVMRATKGAGNPAVINELLEKHLS